MIPKSVNIMGLVFEVNEVENLQLDGEDCHALFSPALLRISIEASSPPEKATAYLLHEMIHATLFRTNASQSIPAGLEEVIVDTIATVISENFDLKPKKRS